MSDYNKNMEMNKDAPASWCPLPWSHISIKARGYYRICCNSGGNNKAPGILKDKNGKPFHIGEANWSHIINSNVMKSVRKDMLKGKWPDECIRCEKEYGSKMNPKNISEQSALASAIEPENYPSYSKAKKLTQSDGSISPKDFPMSYLDIRFGNLCNLKCVMCGPTDSNKWYDDHRAIWEENYFLDRGEPIKLIQGTNGKWRPDKNIFNWSDDPHLWSQIEGNINNFRKMYIAGGEPLLIASHFDFLQKCIDRGIAEKLTIDYNSNITHIPKRAWRLWKYFKSVSIGMSLDGYGPVNDFIRYPSRWDQMEKNLEKFDTAEGNLNLKIATAVNVFNIWHLPEFIEYIMKKNYKQIGGHSILMRNNSVYRPYHLNVNILEDSFKEKIKNRFNNYKKKFSDFNYQSVYGESNLHSWQKKIQKACNILDNHTEYMNEIQYNNVDLKKQRRRFIHFTDKLDELRQTKWPETFPQLYESTLKWREL